MTNVVGALVFGGHIGTISQAHNAVYLGRGTARTHRLLPDGTVLAAGDPEGAPLPRVLQSTHGGGEHGGVTMANKIGLFALKPSPTEFEATANEIGRS